MPLKDGVKSGAEGWRRVKCGRAVRAAKHPRCKQLSRQPKKQRIDALTWTAAAQEAQEPQRFLMTEMQHRARGACVCLYRYSDSAPWRISDIERDNAECHQMLNKYTYAFERWRSTRRDLVWGGRAWQSMPEIGQSARNGRIGGVVSYASCKRPRNNRQVGTLILWKQPPQKSTPRHTKHIISYLSFRMISVQMLNLVGATLSTLSLSVC